MVQGGFTKLFVPEPSRSGSDLFPPDGYLELRSRTGVVQVPDIGILRVLHYFQSRVLLEPRVSVCRGVETAWGCTDTDTGGRKTGPVSVCLVCPSTGAERGGGGTDRRRVERGGWSGRGGERGCDLWSS